MKRKYIPLAEALRQAKECNPFLEKTDGICSCYDIENMGFMRDGVSRWYQFTSVNGEKAYTIKR